MHPAFCQTAVCQKALNGRGDHLPQHRQGHRAHDPLCHSLFQQRHGGFPPVFQLTAHPRRHHRVFLVQLLHLPQVQRGVFRRHGNDDRPQLLLQSTAARQNFLLAVVDLRKGMVYHVQQKGLLGGVNGVDGLFADVQRLCHLLHGEMQPLLTE